MARYKLVPCSDHVARYCNPQRVIRDPITNEITGVYPQAFELNLKIKEIYLSTYWMECPPENKTTLDAQFKSVLAKLRPKHRNVKTEGAFARLHVGSIVNAGLAGRYALRVNCRSKGDDPGYTGIYGMPQDNADKVLLQSLASSECCTEIRGVAEIER